jgi:hypothetical protein
MTARETASLTYDISVAKGARFSADDPVVLRLPERPNAQTHGNDQLRHRLDGQ